MIIYHQNNVAGFAGAHVWYWPVQPIVQPHIRISVAGALLAAHSQIADVVHRNEIASVFSRNEIGAVIHRNEIADI